MWRGRWVVLVTLAVLTASCGQSRAVATPVARAVASAVQVTDDAVPEAGANTFKPLSPARLLDTRSTTPFGPGEVRTLPVAGRGGVASGAVAVVLNVTVTGSTAAGWLSVFPAGAAFPGTSNLNFTQGQTVANLVMVGLGAGGAVSVLSAGGQAHVIVDVQGWYSGGFNPVGPTRALDTRGTGGPLGAGETLSLTLGGRFGIPSGALAVALNVTVTQPTAGGWLSVFPGATAFPGSSSLNFSPGQTRANMVLVGLGGGGRVSLFNAVGSAHVIVDVTGWVSSGFHPVTPARIADTRVGVCGVRLGHGDVRSFAILDRGGVPAANVNAVAVNLTAVAATATTFLTVYPKGQPRPGTSNLNLVRGDTVANLVTTGIGPDGAVSISNASGTVDVVLDVTGWYEGTGAGAPQFDCQLLPAEVPRAPTGAWFPPGSFAVPGQVTAGRYVAAGGGGCVWQRFGPGGERRGAGGGGVRPILDVMAGDSGVASTGCGNWVAYGAASEVAAAVGDGDWVVGEDMLPGVYASSGAAPCRWEHLMGFTGEGDERIDDGLAFGQALVEIAPFEVGFRSHGCGGWRWLAPPRG